MGWNLVRVVKPSRLFKFGEREERFYFVHSFHTVCYNKIDVLGTTEHGCVFSSAFERDNIFGVQFHPEKSHKYGYSLLKRFSEI